MAKIKKFAKDYITKVLRKIEKKRRESSSGKNGASSAVVNDDHMDESPGDSSLAQAALDDIMDMEVGDDGDDLQDEHFSLQEPSPEETPDGSRSSPHENNVTPSQLPSTLDSIGPHTPDSDHDWADGSRIAVGHE